MSAAADPALIRIPFCRRFPATVAVLATLALGTATATASRAIITKGGTGRNLSRPAGEYAGRGWELTGEWGGFLGVPIAPHYFVTAKHVGGGVGQKLLFRGAAYTTVEALSCPDSDLGVWRVRERFPVWAQLYPRRDEAGKEIFLVGRGTARGAPVVTQQGVLRGWRWGADDHRQSWGVNRVLGIADYTNPAGHWRNDLLTFAFDADGGPHEGIVSGSDSGGAVFLQDTDGVWKLGGILYGVDGTPYAPTAEGKGAAGGAFLDTRDLYERDRRTGEMHYHDPLRPAPEPTVAGATRISSSLPYLQSVVPDLRPFPWVWILAGVAAATTATALAIHLRRRGSALLQRRQARGR
ncbi:MAG: hypothetical protein H7Z41_11580 [Cytophagales bacterium]|nr:hypothetical protein [Armatimonadota bacterium]